MVEGKMNDKMTHAEFALAARKDILRMLYKSSESHIGSNLSCIDILTVLYNGVLRVDPKNSKMPNRDRFVLSKGHAICSLFACLARRGFIPEDDLKRYCTNGSNYAGEPRRDFVPGVEISAGSLGHGLPIATGMALACRKKRDRGHVFCLIGEGECNEGSVWEAVMFAAKHRLCNLTLIIDRNGLQSYAREMDVLDMGDLSEKLRVFGWDAVDIDGHNYTAIETALKTTHEQKPFAIIAHTVKGKGISFMENKLEWHFLSPKEKDYEVGMKELDACVIQ
jgi:transketolase